MSKIKKIFIDKQSLFDYNNKAPKTRRCGEIGRRKGLKIPRWQHRTGSSPVSGTSVTLDPIRLWVQRYFFLCDSTATDIFCYLLTEKNPLLSTKTSEGSFFMVEIFTDL